MTRILSDHSDGLQRIVAFVDGQLYVCNTSIQPNTLSDGRWRWMNEDGSTGAHAALSTVKKLDRALLESRGTA